MTSSYRNGHSPVTHSSRFHHTLVTKKGANEACHEGLDRLFSSLCDECDELKQTPLESVWFSFFFFETPLCEKDFLFEYCNSVSSSCQIFRKPSAFTLIGKQGFRSAHAVYHEFDFAQSVDSKNILNGPELPLTNGAGASVNRRPSVRGSYGH